MSMSELNSQYDFEASTSKDGWMSMKQPGTYQVRVISEVFPYQKAPFKPGDKPKTVFLCHVIDRADGKYKLWEMGWSIMKQYKTLSADPECTFEDYPPYDLKVIKKKTGPEIQNVEYQVIHGMPKPLTQEELDGAIKLKDIKEIGLKLTQKQATKFADAIEPTPTYAEDEIDPADIPF